MRLPVNLQVQYAPELDFEALGRTPGRMTPGRTPLMTPGRMSPSRTASSLTLCCYLFISLKACNITFLKMQMSLPGLALTFLRLPLAGCRAQPVASLQIASKVASM